MKKTLSLFMIVMIIFTFASCNNPKSVEYHPSGIEGNLLYVNVDGNTYVYERTDEDCDEFTRHKWVDSYVTESNLETVTFGNEWMVYSIEEYPDFEYVWVVSAVGDICSIYHIANV